MSDFKNSICKQKLDCNPNLDIKFTSFTHFLETAIMPVYPINTCSKCSNAATCTTKEFCKTCDDANFCNKKKLLLLAVEPQNTVHLKEAQSTCNELSSLIENPLNFFSLDSSMEIPENITELARISKNFINANVSK